MKETILTITAHDDDNIFGMGGTILKYKKEGKKIITIVCSFGESSNPWLKKEYIRSKRIKEWGRVAEKIGVSQTIFLGMTETKFKKEFPEKKAMILKIIEEHKPSRIFTHSVNDMHPDHRDTINFVKELVIENDLDIPIYCFEVWTPLLWKKNMPSAYIDITDTFKEKMALLKMFKSQAHVRVNLNWSIYLRGILNGFYAGCKYAERFSIIR